MPLYRKKPVVIEAAQWLKDGDHPAVIGGQIQTLEGPLNVSPGDWIITGVNGEHYPCKPDIFEKTYEPVKAVSSSRWDMEDDHLE